MYNKNELLNIMSNAGATRISENNHDGDIMFSRPSIFGFGYLWAFADMTREPVQYSLGRWMVSSQDINKIISKTL